MSTLPDTRAPVLTTQCAPTVEPLTTVLLPTCALGAIRASDATCAAGSTSAPGCASPASAVCRAREPDDYGLVNIVCFDLPDITLARTCLLSSLHSTAALMKTCFLVVGRGDGLSWAVYTSEVGRQHRRCRNLPMRPDCLTEGR